MTEPPSSSGGSQARVTEVLVLSVTLGCNGGPGGSVQHHKDITQMLDVGGESVMNETDDTFNT